MDKEVAVRFPPPLATDSAVRNPDGTWSMPLQPVVIECGQRVRLRGVLVQCIRRAHHPVRINYGHSNGYEEWCFDEEPADG